MNLSFYINYKEKFIIENIILLELNFRGDIIQKSSIVMITADTMVTIDNTIGIVTDNYIKFKGLI